MFKGPCSWYKKYSALFSTSHKLLWNVQLFFVPTELQHGGWRQLSYLQSLEFQTIKQNWDWHMTLDNPLNLTCSFRILAAQYEILKYQFIYKDFKEILPSLSLVYPFIHSFHLQAFVEGQPCAKNITDVLNTKIIR